MKILALETTDAIGSVAAMADGKMLLELDLNPKQRAAQSLTPGIKNLLGQVGWKAADIQLVALTIGPGSFTGLRIGVTLAKTFAYAVGAEILGVNTLDAIAEAAPVHVSALTACIDAQRGDIVVRSYNRDHSGLLNPSDDEHLIPIENWLSELLPGATVTGPGLSKLAARVPTSVTALDRKYWTPRAAMVAKVAHRQYGAGCRNDLWTLAPHYSRPSAAQEKWDAGLKKTK